MDILPDILSAHKQIGGSYTMSLRAADPES